MLVTGGEDSLSAPLATTEIYDPNANAWTPSANMNGSRAGGLLVPLPDARARGGLRVRFEHRDISPTWALVRYRARFAGVITMLR